MKKRIKRLLKKFMFIFVLIPTMVLIVNLETKAAYIPGYDLHLDLANIEIPYIDYDDNKPYIMVSYDKYFNNPFSYATIRYVEGNNVSVNSFLPMQTINYFSSDFDYKSDSFKETKFLQWFGGSEGYTWASQFVLLEIQGGNNLPLVEDSELYYYSTNYGHFLLADYFKPSEATTLFSTHPTTLLNLIGQVQLIGYNQGETDTVPSVAEAYQNGVNVGIQQGRVQYQQLIYDLEGQIEIINSITIPNERNNYYNIGYQAGIDAGNPAIYQEGYLAGQKDIFYSKFDKWIVPAIVIVIILGGFVAISVNKSRRRDDY